MVCSYVIIIIMCAQKIFTALPVVVQRNQAKIEGINRLLENYTSFFWLSETKIDDFGGQPHNEDEPKNDDNLRQAGTELRKAQLKLELGFTSTNLHQMDEQESLIVLWTMIASKLQLVPQMEQPFHW